MTRPALPLSTIALVLALGCGGRESGTSASTGASGDGNTGPPGTVSGGANGSLSGMSAASGSSGGTSGGPVGDMGMAAPPPASAGASTGSTNSGGCALNSDCISGFVCALGECRPPCQIDADCAGGTCVFGVTDGVKTFFCRTPADENTPCPNPSDCMAPLACASDYRCRNLCVTNADCNAADVTNMVCAQDASGIDYCASPSDVTVTSMGAQVISAPPPLGAMTGTAVTEPVDASMQSEPAITSTCQCCVRAGQTVPPGQCGATLDLTGSASACGLEAGVVLDGFCDRLCPVPLMPMYLLGCSVSDDTSGGHVSCAFGGCGK